MAAARVKLLACAGQPVKLAICGSGKVQFCAPGGGPPPLTPDCCQSSDCCFDKANGRFRGHYMALWKFYTTSDGTGAPAHTLLIEFDFDFPVPADPCANLLQNLRTDMTGVSAFVMELDGAGVGFADASVPPSTAPTITDFTAAFFYEGSGAWRQGFIPTLSFAWLSTIPSSVVQLGLDGVEASGGVTAEDQAGDCLGFPDIDFTDELYVRDFASAHGAFIDATQSVVTTSHLDLVLVNNYCCKDEDGACQPREDHPQTEGSGACS